MNKDLARFDFDAVVVGAGAVGLACGYALSSRGLAVAVLEAEAALGQGISSRNSEVIHGGLYYPTGSLKARLCVNGRKAIYAFLEAHNVRYARCGKLIVASSVSLDRIEAVFQQARSNGVDGIRLLSRAELGELEPELTAEMAIFSPDSGVLDSHGYMLALQGEIERAGAVVCFHTPFAEATPLTGCGFRIRTAALIRRFSSPDFLLTLQVFRRRQWRTGSSAFQRN